MTAEGKVLLGPDWRVNPSDDLLRLLRSEFGDESVSLRYTADLLYTADLRYTAPGSG
jgi:hypothetical protein